MTFPVAGVPMEVQGTTEPNTTIPEPCAQTENWTLFAVPTVRAGWTEAAPVLSFKSAPVSVSEAAPSI